MRTEEEGAPRENSAKQFFGQFSRKGLLEERKWEEKRINEDFA